MPGVRFSARAERDLEEIAVYTMSTWDLKQALHYLGELEECCLKLSAFPELGRPCDEVRPGLRRIEQGRHVIFYREEADGVIVSRILHQRMIPGMHSMVED